MKGVKSDTQDGGSFVKREGSAIDEDRRMEVGLVSVGGEKGD